MVGTVEVEGAAYVLSPLKNVVEFAVPLPSLAVATVPVVKLDAVKFVKALPFA